MVKRKQAEQDGSSSSSSSSSSSKRNSRSSRPRNGSLPGNRLYPEAESDVPLDVDGDDELLAQLLEQERSAIVEESTYKEDDDESDEELLDAEEDDNSEDEWHPPEPPSTRSKQNKGNRRTVNRSDDDEDEDLDADDVSDDELMQSLSSRSAAKSKDKASKSVPVSSDQGEPEDEVDEEAERAMAEVEAAAAWADVRRRQAAASQPAVEPAESAAPASLSTWLGQGPSAASSITELAAALPMPTTCKEAQIVDRSSLFVGYVYPLTNNTSAYIATLLSHLTRVVHPTVPVELLPPQFANAPASKRGSSHDMYAYRVLQLKRGRTGISGPDDFSLQEEKEDDGERWGGDRVLKVAREEGAADALVIVSRWYGGEMLGPIRFEHIENAARAALQKHMADEEIQESRMRILHFDTQIDLTKKKLTGEETLANSQTPSKADAYGNLDLAKAQRLCTARQKTLEALQRRLQAQLAQRQSQGDTLEAPITAQNGDAPSAPNPSSALDHLTPTAKIVPKVDPDEDLPSAATTVPGNTTISVKEEAVDSVSQEDHVSEDGVDLTGWDEL